MCSLRMSMAQCRSGSDLVGFDKTEALVTQRVDDLLQVTKLVTIFEVFDNEQAAVQSFKSGVAA